MADSSRPGPHRRESSGRGAEDASRSLSISIANPPSPTRRSYGSATVLPTSPVGGGAARPSLAPRRSSSGSSSSGSATASGAGTAVGAGGSASGGSNASSRSSGSPRPSRLGTGAGTSTSGSGGRQRVASLSGAIGPTSPPLQQDQQLPSPVGLPRRTQFTTSTHQHHHHGHHHRSASAPRYAASSLGSLAASADDLSLTSDELLAPGPSELGAGSTPPSGQQVYHHRRRESSNSSPSPPPPASSPPLPGSTSSSTSPGVYVSIGGSGSGSATSAGPIAIAAAMPAAPGVRLSTTPLVPSPLAQASGPNDDDDHAEQTKLGEEDDDDEDDDDNEPLAAWEENEERGINTPFDDMEMSPLMNEAALPENSLGLEPPSAAGSRSRSGSGGEPARVPTHTPQRRSRELSNASTSSGRSGSPETPDSSASSIGRTARPERVRPVSMSVPTAGSDQRRPRHRQSLSLVMDSWKGKATASSPASSVASSAAASPSVPLPTATPGQSTSSPLTRSAAPSWSIGSSSSVLSSSPSAASSGSASSTSPTSRRASSSYVSPPRVPTHVPASPTISRNSRASVSGTLPSSMPTPFPAPPPPSESIKLQRVPDAVRSAIDFKSYSALSSSVPTAPGSFLFGSSGGPTASGSSAMSIADLDDSKIPRTPAATRVPSPATSVSGGEPSIGGDFTRSGPPSGSSSVAHSRVSSRRSSADKTAAGATAAASPPPQPVPPLASPLIMPSSHERSPSGSAFSPLFPFGSSSSAGLVRSSSPQHERVKRHTRATSVSVTSAMGLSPQNLDSASLASLSPSHSLSPSYELGASPFAQGPFLQPPPSSTSQSEAPSLLSTSVREPSMFSRRAANRTSMTPHMSSDAFGENTDEYAQIILASRDAKMRKWKTSGSSTSGLGIPTSPVLMRSKSPGSRKNIPNFDLGPSTSQPGGTSPGALGIEVEWVDWLDEYRKMKEAKLQAERHQSAVHAIAEEGSPVAAAADLPPRAATAEFNPYEASTAAMAQRGMHTPSSSESQRSDLPYNLMTPGEGVNVFPPVHPPTAAPISPTKSAPVAATSRAQTVATSSRPPHHAGTRARTSSFGSGVSPTAKRKRPFHIGNKIDSWWSAVRASFTPGGGPNEERLRAAARRDRYDAPTVNVHTSAAPRVSSDAVRPPASPGGNSLRNAQSATDLKGTIARGGVPSGALAPRQSLAPPPAAGRSTSGSSGSDAASAEDAKDGRRRNPQLSLHLGPEFSTMPPPQEPVSARSDEPSISSSARSSGRSPPALLQTPAWPGMTPGHSPRWDQTPAPVSSSMAETSATAQADAKRPGKATLPSFSAHTVQQQIRQRLAMAKESCDRELGKIVVGITTFVETDMAKRREASTLLALQAGDFGDLADDDENEMQSGASAIAPGSDLESGSEMANATADELEEILDADSLDPGRALPSSSSAHSRSPRHGLSRASSFSSRGRTDSTHRLQVGQRRKSHVPGHRPRAGRKSARASPTSSRSTSRSRSPMPGTLQHSSGSGTRLNSPHLHEAEDAKEHAAFITLLQDISALAIEIVDIPISSFTANAGLCADYIAKIQEIGKAWDDDPSLPCRSFYIQMLLAVAGLSRVVEWWEAEKGFWSFEDNEDEEAAPLTFVAKPSPDTEFTSLRPRQQQLEESSLAEATVAHAQAETSPLGIDMGEPVGAQGEEHPPAEVVDDLRAAVEESRRQTLLIELSLDGQLLQYLSSAWAEITGLEPADCLGLPISDLLFHDDAAVFAEATRQLEADIGHTVEVRFRLRVATSPPSSRASSEESRAESEEFFELMEGKGMLMTDGLTGSSSHTMWVVRPAPLSPSLGAVDAAPKSNAERIARLRALQPQAYADPLSPFAFGKGFALEPILCRICERGVPAWFFEKHNETCHESHRLESDISECNDRIKELLRTIEAISTAIDDPAQTAQYRDIAYEQDLEPFANARLTAAQQESLLELRDILQTALDIGTPGMSEDDASDKPIEQQRLLSPDSDRKLSEIMNWQRPASDDAAMARLVSDVEEQIRYKLNSVNRLRNTLLYSEKVREEWEAKADALVADMDAAAASSAGSLPSSPQLQPPGKASETTAAETRPRSDSQAIDSEAPSSRLLEPMSHLSPVVAAEDEYTRARRKRSSIDPSHLARSDSPSLPAGLLSPRLPAGIPTSRSKVTSIKDFQVIKPISKGAFGSVYLAKKYTTGDYYAIKVLKKSDMVAKNQVTNVKAERMIMMNQTHSDFVVRLYYTFQSRDYLYLVMEYLGGGDLAALVKKLGNIGVEWTRQYLAEVVVGLDKLHSAGVIHRDLKPDNLLVDTRGHLKVTDFGLSRIGLLGRQTRLPAFGQREPEPRRTIFDSKLRSASRDTHDSSSAASTPQHVFQSGTSYFGSQLAVPDNFSLDTPASESSKSDVPLLPQPPRARTDSGVSQPMSTGSGLVGSNKFVGTPDYLAPESILGIGMDAAVDWWALGVICYEFLYGLPPFNDDTPEKVFDNILSRRIEWYEEEMEGRIPPEARDLMERLMCSDPKRRLGSNGAAEVKAHPFFASVDWDNLFVDDGPWAPQLVDIESTDYFDARGANAQQMFCEDDPAILEGPMSSSPAAKSRAPSPPPAGEGGRLPRERSETEPMPQVDFGTFNFRNLPVLKQANDDMLRRLREEQLSPHLALAELVPPGPLHGRAAALAGKGPRHRPSIDIKHPPSPAPSTSSGSSDPSKRSSPSTPLTAPSHSRHPSEQPKRARQASVNVAAPEGQRRSSYHSRARSKSMSDPLRVERKDNSISGRSDSFERQERGHLRRSSASVTSSPSRGSVPLPTVPPPGMVALGLGLPNQGMIDNLVAMHNPISSKVLETTLVRLGCRCVVVPDGSDAILATSDGGVRFDIIWLDLDMPNINGEHAARMIKSTVNPNSECPIVAVCSHDVGTNDEAGTIFSASISKPIVKNDVVNILRKLGFAKQAEENRTSRRGSQESSISSQGRRGSGATDRRASGATDRRNSGATDRRGSNATTASDRRDSGASALLAAEEPRRGSDPLNTLAEDAQETLASPNPNQG